MKEIAFIILLFANYISLYAENNLKEILNGRAYDWQDLPREERAFGVDSKIIYKIDIKKITDLKNERPYLLSSAIKQHLEKHTEIQKSDILYYMNSEQKFILYDYQPTIEYKSYKKLKINDEAIGETSFCANAIDLKADEIFTYHIYFIDNDEIYQFWLGYRCSKSEKQDLTKLTDIFSYENKNLFWKNANSRYDFFLLLNKKDKNLPTSLIKFQQIYDDICSNLKVNDINIEVDYQ